MIAAETALRCFNDSQTVLEHVSARAAQYTDASMHSTNWCTYYRAPPIWAFRRTLVVQLVVHLENIQIAHQGRSQLRLSADFCTIMLTLELLCNRLHPNYGQIIWITRTPSKFLSTHFHQQGHLHNVGVAWRLSVTSRSTACEHSTEDLFHVTFSIGIAHSNSRVKAFTQHVL